MIVKSQNNPYFFRQISKEPSRQYLESFYFIGRFFFEVIIKLHLKAIKYIMFLNDVQINLQG